MKNIYLLVLIVVIIPICISAQKQNEFPILKGEYLGQIPPGDMPEIFAPEIVSTGMTARDIAITPDGKEIYFGLVIGNYNYSTILETKQVNGVWTKPEVAEFASDPRYKTVEPCISPDGKKFFFSSSRPKDNAQEKESDYDIWIMDKTEKGWGEPYNLGSPVNTAEDEFFPSVTQDGTIYFCRQNEKRVDYIFRSRLINNKYSEPEKLPEQVNCGTSQFNAFIAPDESFIIVPAFGRKDSKGSTDYYIVFRSKDDKWSEPINLGDKINTASGNEYSPYVSREGKYFFFMSARIKNDFFKAGEKLTFDKLKKIHNSPGNSNSSIYWVEAKFIDELKKQVK